ncbi:MAG: hypothetical protein ACXAB2_13460, partial [Candidatus Hodarchaeales archaeon]
REEVRNIIHERFRRLSQKKKIVGIIENTNGFKTDLIPLINKESFSILLTQGNVIVGFNTYASRDPQIKKYFLAENQTSAKTIIQVLENNKDFDIYACFHPKWIHTCYDI